MQRGDTVLLELPVTIDEVPGMTCEAATSALRQSLTAAGFSSPAISRAFELFEGAARQPGVPFQVETFSSNGNLTQAMRVANEAHDVMQAVTDNPVAHDLAVRAADASPDTHFEHSMRGDACRLTATCTNAPAS